MGNSCPHMCLLFMTPTVVWPLRRESITENIIKYNIICIVPFGGGKRSIFTDPCFMILCLLRVSGNKNLMFSWTIFQRKCYHLHLHTWVDEPTGCSETRRAVILRYRLAAAPAGPGLGWAWHFQAQAGTPSVPRPVEVFPRAFFGEPQCIS